VQSTAHVTRASLLVTGILITLAVPFGRAHAQDGEPRSEHAETRDAAAAWLVTAGLGLALALPAFAVVTSQAPTFGDRTPEWAMATLGGSAIVGPFSVLALGAGLDFARGGDGRDGLVAASIADLLIGVVLGSLATAFAPGVGATWASAGEQSRAAELLGVEAFGFVLSGSIALTAALFFRPEPRS
jgi:hypothetical protein